MRKAAKVRSPVSVHFARRFPQQSELATLSALQRQLLPAARALCFGWKWLLCLEWLPSIPRDFWRSSIEPLIKTDIIWAVRSITLKMVWAHAGSGWRSCLRCLACWLVSWALVPLLRSTESLPQQTISLIQIKAVLPLHCSSRTTPGLLSSWDF